MKITVKENNVKDTLTKLIIGLILFHKHIYNTKHKFILLKANSHFITKTEYSSYNTQKLFISYINNTLIIIYKHYTEYINKHKNIISYQKIIISATKSELLNFINILKLNPNTLKDIIYSYTPDIKPQSDTLQNRSYNTYTTLAEYTYNSLENISKKYILNNNNKLHLKPKYMLTTIHNNK